MALLGEKVNVLVEIKTTSWRGLTDNQPESYLRWLLNNNNSAQKYFVALVPPTYYHHDELKERIEAFKISAKHNSVHILILNWADIIRVVSDNDLQLLNPYINDFCNLLSEWYETPVARMTFEETQMVYTRLSSFFQ